MGVQPIRIDAGIFGWVQRKRLCWASGPRGENVAWQTQAVPDDAKLTWDGDKQMSMTSYGEAHPSEHQGARRLQVEQQEA